MGTATSYRLFEDGTQNKRHYLKIEKFNKRIKVLELTQERGGFPKLNDSFEVSSSRKLREFLENYYQQRLSPEFFDLKDWAVNPEIQYAGLLGKRFKKGLFGRRKNKEIWKATASWNESWEHKYGEWIKNNVKEDFFKKYNISTDCADAVIGTRWIFSRIHGLPVANHVSNSSSLLTNYSMPRAWRYLNKAKEWHKDVLFLTALNYVMALSSTKTIKLDTYPVSLTKQGLSVGSMLLTEGEESNHVKLISENNFEDPTNLPLFTLTSTVPRKVRLLVKEVVVDQGWPKRNEKSFLKFRWPIVSRKKMYLKSNKYHSDFSVEQYSEVLRKETPVFIEFLLQRLKNNYDPVHFISFAIEDVLKSIESRIEIVKEGYQFCTQNDCKEGSANWDAWSTPSRDKKLIKKFSNMDLLVSKFESISPGLTKQWLEAQLNSRVIILGFNLSLKTIRYLFENDLASSNPRDHEKKRWGINIEENGTRVINQILSLLNKRKQIIESQSEDCSLKDCFPKSPKWLSWNTFKVDEQLLIKVNELKRVCTIFDEDVCMELLLSDGATFDSGIENLTIREWIKRIPLFYSNLNVSKRRRWGDLEGKRQVAHITFNKNIFFSDNNYALVDNKKIINLETDSISYEARDKETLYLSLKGNLLVHNEKTDSFLFGIFDSKDSPTFEILKDFKIPRNLNVKTFFTTKESVFLEFENVERNKTWVVAFNKKGQIKRELSKSKRTGRLIYFPETLELYDLHNNNIIKISDKINKVILNNKKIKLENLLPIAINGSLTLFNYYDENYGVMYPLILLQSHYISLNLDISKNIELKHFDLERGLFFLEHKISEEFPSAYLASIEQGKIQLEKLGNSFFQIRTIDGVYFTATFKGSAWDQNRNPILKKFDHGRFVNPRIDSGFSFSHIGEKGLFFNNEDVFSLGQYFRYSNNQMSRFNTPGFLRAKEKLCSNVSKKTNSYVEQFSFQYGDYNCYATVYEDERKTHPVFTQKFKGQENLFIDIDGSKNQVYEFTGENTILWWGKKYN